MNTHIPSTYIHQLLIFWHAFFNALSILPSSPPLLSFMFAAVTFVCKHLYKYVLSFLLDKYLRVNGWATW